VVIPYLRGYGPTRFLSRDTLRSGEQAALAGDLLALLDALGIAKAVLGGFDWGGRACCIVSAIWPERVIALVSGNSYNIQNIARSLEPASAEREAAFPFRARTPRACAEPPRDYEAPLEDVVTALAVRRHDV
jgi:pimeloyl-ACP methyl ester carboxylesterase